MVRYSIVFVCQMAASGILVSLLSVIPIPTVIVKAIIDTILFLSSIIFKKIGYLPRNKKDILLWDVFKLCAGHGMSSVGDKPTTGSYRQV